MVNVFRFRRRRSVTNLLTKADVVYNIIAYTILFILFAIIVYPLLYVVSASFTTSDDLIAGVMYIFPTSWTLDNYVMILKDSRFLTSFMCSVLYVVVGTVLSVLVTICVAYPLSRKDFVMKSPIIKFFSVTLFFSGGFVPSYILIRNILHLNRIPLLAMAIPSLLSVWNVILVRTYFMSTIPSELYEAAKMDGCGNIRFLFQIVMPISKPILAVLIMYNVLGRWNSYIDAQLYIDDQAWYPLQLILRQYLLPTKGEGLTDNYEGLKYAVMVISSIPMIIVCLFTQKYFKKGAMLGSMKG